MLNVAHRLSLNKASQVSQHTEALYAAQLLCYYCEKGTLKKCGIFTRECDWELVSIWSDITKQ